MSYLSCIIADVDKKGLSQVWNWGCRGGWCIK